MFPRIPDFETRGKRVVNHHGRYIPGKVSFRTHEIGWLVQTPESVLELLSGIILLLPRIEQRFFGYLSRGLVTNHTTLSRLLEDTVFVYVSHRTSVRPSAVNDVL